MSGKEQKRERAPFSAHRTRLTFRYKDKDFHKKWHAHLFTDKEDRIQRALDAGYVFVDQKELAGVGDREVHGGNTDLNSKVSRVVNGARDGNPEERGILMKLPIDWYNEDQAVKEKTNALVDRAVRAGKAGGADIENSYGDVNLS